MDTYTETKNDCAAEELQSSTSARNSISQIGKKCTFPDLTSFPIHSIFDVNEKSTLVCYYNEDAPQIVWVPNEFISND